MLCDEVPLINFTSNLYNIDFTKYSQTCANGHLWTTATCQQRPAQVPCPTNRTMTLPRILDQTLNSGHPLNNGHFFGVPRVAVVHRFDCTQNITKIVAYPGIEYSNLLTLVITKIRGKSIIKATIFWKDSLFFRFQMAGCAKLLV